MDYSKALEIMKSYKRGRPSKKVLLARRVINEDNDTLEYKVETAKREYNKFAYEQDKNINKQKREADNLLKKNLISKKDYNMIIGHIDELKKLNKETRHAIYRRANAIYAEKKFRDCLKSYTFDYGELNEEMYNRVNIDRLFYAVLKDILYSEDSLLKRFNNNFSNKTYYIRFSLGVSYKKITDADKQVKVFIQTRIRKLLSGYRRSYEIKDLLFNELKTEIYNRENGESGLVVLYFDKLYFDIIETDTIAIKGYIETPKWLSNKKMTINIKNEDNKCFFYAVALGFLVNKGVDITHIRKHTDKPGVLLKQLKENNIIINEDGLTYPVPLDSRLYNKFEMNNNIKLNVFAYTEEGKDKTVNAIYLSKNDYNKEAEINIMIIGDKSNYHYLYITDINKIYSKHGIEKRKHKSICYICGNSILTNHMEEHKKICNDINNKQYKPKIIMPKPGRLIKFKNFERTTRIPSYIVADFECVLIPVEDNNGTNTRKILKHLPCSYALKVVSDEEEIKELYKDIILYRGINDIDTMNHFAEDIHKIQLDITNIYKRNKKMTPLTKEQWKEYNKATKCYMCEGEFTDKNYKVRDHNHITGDYIGPACNFCNLRRAPSRYFIPLVFHNLKGYDSHIIVQYLSRDKYKYKFDGIPLNKEKFLSLTLEKETDKENRLMKIRVIDSLQFLLASLESLTESLKKSGIDKFKYMNEYFKDKTNLILRKNAYPYKWFDSFDKFNYPAEWKMEDFEEITEEKYNTYKDVVKEFNIKTAGEYSDLYLTCDVLELADIIENARAGFLKTHKLDMLYYYGAPGFAWDCFLYNIKDKIEGLELLSDVDMLYFFQNMIRGGQSFISHRYAKANNEYCSDYNKEVDKSYIQYFDMTNLYGWSMKQKLPYKGFQWLEEKDINTLNDMFKNNDINKFERMIKLNENNNIGFCFEVDLIYPEELHKHHNMYPLAPEKYTPTINDLSEFTIKLKQKLQKREDIKLDKTPLLIQTLNNKNKYIIHYKTLLLYIQLGLKVDKIYRAVKFEQTNFMADYIDMNTELRNKADNGFEKDLYKLLNNSVYGKTFENVLNYSNVEFVQDEKQFKKQTNNILFKDFIIINNELSLIESYSNKCIMNKPIYLGACITDYAKYQMFNFHYNVALPYWGFDNIQLLMTDTDSLVYHIKTNDIYKDLGELNKRGLMDTSTLKGLSICNDTYKKVGIMKPDEPDNILEFVGLRSKMYSYITDKDNTIKKLKGVTKKAMRSIIFNDYKEALFNDNINRVSMNNIRSYKQEIYNIESFKVALSADDTKRFIEEDGITTRAFGFKE